MKTHEDAHLRSIMKAVSYRLLAAITTTTIVFVFTRKIALSLGIGAVEAVAKVICYYIHVKNVVLYRFWPEEISVVFLARKSAFERKRYGGS